MIARAFLLTLLLEGLCACDSVTDGTSPDVRIFEPSVDTLIIGQPLRLRAEAEDARQIVFVEVTLSYQSKSEDPILRFLVENPSRTALLTLDTTLHIPAALQPTALTGERVVLVVRADDDRNSGGEGIAMVAVPPAPVP